MEASSTRVFRLWNFPSCFGTLDGKRFLLAKLNNSGSEYFDYKGHCSIIMLALVDAAYKFLYVDVGTNGRDSDGGVWEKSSLKEAVESQQLHILPPSNISFIQRVTLYIIVADNAFPLKPWLMKPYKGNNLPMEKFIYNYRHSTTSQVSENAFWNISQSFPDI